jgi:hypothetical protein
MRRWIFAAVPVLVLFGALPAVRADRVPDEPPAPAAQKIKLVVELDANAKQPRLVIPRSLANPPKKAGAGLNVPTIVAGVALTLAMVSAGFWFIRRGPGRSVAMIVVFVSLFALGVSAVYADVGPGPRPRPPLPPAAAAIKLPADVQLTEDVLVEFTDKGDAIRLIVNKANVLKTDKAEKQE